MGSVDRHGGSGGPLPGPVRAKMERALGADFSDVRVHQGPQAASIGAIAYTRGRDIHFRPGGYEPGSDAGRKLLAHELTHVVQQRHGRVATPQGTDIPINADPALEREAEAAGERTVRAQAGPALTVARRRARGSREPAAASIQRATEDDERDAAMGRGATGFAAGMGVGGVAGAALGGPVGALVGMGVGGAIGGGLGLAAPRIARGARAAGRVAAAGGRWLGGKLAAGKEWLGDKATAAGRYVRQTVSPNERDIEEMLHAKGAKLGGTLGAAMQSQEYKDEYKRRHPGFMRKAWWGQKKEQLGAFWRSSRKEKAKTIGRGALGFVPVVGSLMSLRQAGQERNRAKVYRDLKHRQKEAGGEVGELAHVSRSLQHHHNVTSVSKGLGGALGLAGSAFGMAAHPAAAVVGHGVGHVAGHLLGHGVGSFVGHHAAQAGSMTVGRAGGLAARGGGAIGGTATAPMLSKEEADLMMHHLSQHGSDAQKQEIRRLRTAATAPVNPLRHLPYTSEELDQRAALLPA